MLAIDTSALGEDEASQRGAARQRVREVLARHAGPGWVQALAEQRRAARRAPLPVSISHARDLSMLAWCRRGSVGIDLLDAGLLVASPHDDLAATAALYLGPHWAWSEAAAQGGDDTVHRFAHAWAAHEAKLKAGGQGLVEWTVAPRHIDRRCLLRPVYVPAAARPPQRAAAQACGGAAASGHWVAWVAYAAPVSD